MKKTGFIIILIALASTPYNLQAIDSLAIHWVGHGSVYFEFNGLVIHVDPNSAQGNYETMPKADLICITHKHGDHYNLDALSKIKTDSTLMVFTQEVKDDGTYTDTSIVLNNWDSLFFKTIKVKAVPAYNIPPGDIFHPEGDGNGYIFTFNDRTVYVAGDTENIPEMDSLGKIDIAFLPMNLPYTMTPEQAKEAALAVAPNILYIYHFGPDTAEVRSLLSHTNIDIRTGQHLRYEYTIGQWPEIEVEEIPNNYQDVGLNTNRLFPNPTSEILYIADAEKDTELLIYDSRGILLHREIIRDEGLHKADLNFLSKGIYFARLKNKASDHTQSLIIE